jgi:hypothetical protein
MSNKLLDPRPVQQSFATAVGDRAIDVDDPADLPHSRPAPAVVEPGRHLGDGVSHDTPAAGVPPVTTI